MGTKSHWPRAVLLILVAASLFAVLEFFHPPENTLLWRSAIDAGHVPLFGFFSLVALGAVRLFTRSRNLHPLVPYALSFVISAAFCVLTEFLQYFGPRDADFGDLGRGLIGGLAFLLLALAFDREVFSATSRRIRVRTMLVVASMVLLGAGFASFASLGRAYTKRSEAFPRICEFGASWEASFYGVKDAELTVTALPEEWREDSDDRAGRLTFHPATYPGFHIDEMHPDWRGYDRFCLDVYSEQKAPLELVVRLHDIHHDKSYFDRFNRSVIIMPGSNQICVPLAEIREAPRGREMDMRQMKSVAVFEVNRDSTFSVYLDAIRLEVD
jgi:hypothetical protein